MQTISLTPRALAVALLAAAVSAGSLAYAAGKYSAGPAIVKKINEKRGKPLNDKQKAAINDAARARHQALDAANAQFVSGTAKASGLSEQDTRAILDDTIVPAGETVGILDDLILPAGKVSILDNTF